jgi:hypothetical protein
MKRTTHETFPRLRRKSTLTSHFESVIKFCNNDASSRVREQSSAMTECWYETTSSNIRISIFGIGWSTITYTYLVLVVCLITLLSTILVRDWHVAMLKDHSLLF